MGKHASICQTLEELFINARNRKDTPDMEMLIEAYVYAKKMNHKLEEHKRVENGSILPEAMTSASQDSIDRWIKEITEHGTH